MKTPNTYLVSPLLHVMSLHCVNPAVLQGVSMIAQIGELREAAINLPRPLSMGGGHFLEKKNGGSSSSGGSEG